MKSLEAWNLDAKNTSGINDSFGAGVSSSAATDVYTLDGMVVRRNADAANPLEDLPKGVYIVNGRKMIK